LRVTAICTTALSYVLQTLTEPSPLLAVVCETHEDFLVFHEWGPELVSVKQREPTQGPWTLSQLCERPLSHLGELVDPGPFPALSIFDLIAQVLTAKRFIWRLLISSLRL
jgi:hypothetical protein